MEEKVFINIQVDRELKDLVNDYRFEKRCPSEAEAVRQLLRFALEQLKHPSD